MTVAASVKTYLDQQGIAYELVPHPRTGSSRESARAAHVREDHIAKAVIMKDDQGYLMAVIPADQWLKLHAVCETLNRSLELASEAEIEGLFPDCRPGAIPPLGPFYGLETVLDEALTTLANVYLEAGDHEHLIHVTGEQFHSLMSGARHGHFSHND